MDRDIDREEERESAPAEGVPFRARLKVVAHYALLASPVLALLALILAIVALVLGRSTPPPDDSAARIESLNASLAATRNELETLKFIMAGDRASRAEERKMEGVREGKIIRHLSDLETRLKIHPTLEEQLNAAASAVAPAIPRPADEAATDEAEPEPAPAKKTPTDSAKVQSLKEAIEKFNSTPQKKR